MKYSLPLNFMKYLDFTRDDLSQQLYSSLPAGIDPLELTIHEIEVDFDGIVPSKLETSSEHDISFLLSSF